MFEKLGDVVRHYDEISNKLQNPAVIHDQEQYRNLMKEYKQLTPIVEKYREYEHLRTSAEEAKGMLDEGGLDHDFKELVEEEWNTSRAGMEAAAEELKILLLPTDPNDERNVVVEIRGGAGGDEAALFASVLYRMYTLYAESRRWKTEMVSVSETELGGFKEVSFMIEGEGAYSRLKYESGVHRVQRVPETETQGRVHTSTVTVAVLPEAEDVEIDINPSRPSDRHLSLEWRRRAAY